MEPYSKEYSALLARQLKSIHRHPWQEKPTETAHSWMLANAHLDCPAGWSYNIIQFPHLDALLPGNTLYDTGNIQLSLAGRFSLPLPIMPIIFSIQEPSHLVVRANDQNYYLYNHSSGELRYLGMWESTDVFIEDEGWMDTDRGVVKSDEHSTKAITRLWEEQNTKRWLSQKIINEAH